MTKDAHEKIKTQPVAEDPSSGDGERGPVDGQPFAGADGN